MAPVPHWLAVLLALYLLWHLVHLTYFLYLYRSIFIPM